jgi:hypothetical protein
MKKEYGIWKKDYTGACMIRVRLKRALEYLEWSFDDEGGLDLYAEYAEE